MSDRRPQTTPPHGERGQAAPLALLAVLFAALLALGVVRVGSAAGDAASAQAAADATALAAAADGRDAASEVAAANDAEVVRYEAVGDDVRVTVDRHGARATARARWQPVPIP